jgi:hypothetical protein
MSNSRDLLKEAIADAKSVKEAAIANAKAALEEAFTPYLQEKFAAKLAEMELEEEEVEETEMTDENYGEDKMKEAKEDKMEEAYDDKMEEADKMDELDLEELLAELDEEMEKTEGVKKDDLMEAEEEEEIEMDSEEEVEDEEIDLDDMSEEDLKALIEDVIADMVAAGELEAGDNFEEEGDEEEDIDIDMEDEESEEEEIMERKNYGGKEGDESKDKGAYAKKKEGHGRGPLKKDSAEAEGKTDYRKNLKEEEVNEVNIADFSSWALQNPEQAMAAAAAAIAGASAAPAILKALAKKIMSFIKGDKVTSEAEVEEMQSQIEELASTLSEVKLLNAKLLYTNKIFRAKNLNESQKVKVLEAFDKAATVKEAKLIYETLTTVKETKTAVTESMRGMASKAVGVAPEKKPILEVNNQFARWQILAGIKKQ